MATTAESIRAATQNVTAVENYLNRRQSSSGGWVGVGSGTAPAKWLADEGSGAAWIPIDYQTRFFVLAANLVVEALNKEPAIMPLGGEASVRWIFLRAIERNGDIFTWAGFGTPVLQALVKAIGNDPDPLVRIQVVKALNRSPIPTSWFDQLEQAVNLSEASLPAWRPYGSDAVMNQQAAAVVSAKSVDALRTDLAERKAQIASSGFQPPGGIAPPIPKPSAPALIAAGLGIVAAVGAAVARTPRGAR